MVDFLFVLFKLCFAIYYDSGGMRRNAHTLAVFTGRSTSALKFYLDRIVPINHYWHQRTRDTGLPDSKDRISLCCLILTQYRV